MDINLPFSEYYPNSNDKFLDPLFVPYHRYNVPIDDQGCNIQLNTWQNMGEIGTYFDKSQLRIDWNQDYQKIYPNDPCGPGWHDLGNGICSKIHEEAADSNFYTKDQFKVQYQYPNNYTINLRNEKNVKTINEKYGRNSPTFNGANFNPKINNYVNYYDTKITKDMRKYGGLPTRHSYLGL
jgi:hypothetical protein